MKYLTRIKKAIKKFNGYDWEKQFQDYCVPFIKLDCLFTWLIVGADPEMYRVNEFFKMRLSERKKYFNSRDVIYITKEDFKRASKEEITSIGNKYLFNCKYKKWVKREFLLTDDADESAIESFIRENKVILAKELTNTQGKGIHQILYHEDTVKKEAAELKNGHYIIEQKIVQHSLMETLNPSSCNTIRIATFLDKMHKAHIIGACLRVGNKGAFVDNFHSGGVVYPIDLETGIVFAQGKNNTTLERYIYNPAADVVVLGFKVPNWETVKQNVTEAAELSDKIRLISWDIAVTEDGTDFVEANLYGDAKLFQLNSVGVRRMIKNML